jgi:hypothetical protein
LRIFRNKAKRIIFELKRKAKRGRDLCMNFMDLYALPNITAVVISKRMSSTGREEYLEGRDWNRIHS